MSNEIKVGIITFVALLSSLIIVFFIKDIEFGEKGKEYVIQFNFLNNLMEGGHVKLSGGIKVGKISKIEPSEDVRSANVYININNQIVLNMLENPEIYSRAEFTITGAGLLGEKYVLLSFTDKIPDEFDITWFEKEILGKLNGKDREYIQGFYTKDEKRYVYFLNRQLQHNQEPRIARILKSLQHRQTVVRGIEATSIEDILGRVQNIAKKLDNIITEDVKEITGEVKVLLKKGEIKEILKNVSMASYNLNQLMLNTNDLVLELKNKHLNKTFPLVNKTLINTNNEIKSLSRDIQAVLNTANSGLENIFNNPDGILSLTKKGTATLDNVNILIDQLNSISKNLDDPNTPAGALIKDTVVGEDLKKTIKNLNQLTEGLKSNPFFSNENIYRPGPY